MAARLIFCNRAFWQFEIANLGAVMRTYKVIQDEIAKLQAEAGQVLKVAREEAIAEVKAKIAEFGLSAKDLGLVAAGSPVRQGKGRLPGKYRSVEGKEWSGRGRKPEWIKDALAAGKSLDEFKI